MAQLPSVTILGAGRMGQGLALALRGREVSLVSRRRHPVAPQLQLYTGARVDAVAKALVLILAVPDDAVTVLATDLAAERTVGPRHTVLHLSGLLDRGALSPLAPSGAALGSFHPLQTIADPAAAPERLAGAYAGLEGDPRAVEVGEQLAEALRMVPVRVSAGGKAAYHAGAAMVANYTVALLSVAERLAREAGIPPETAARLYLPLLGGVVANLDSGVAAALTGPVRRGDVQTIRAHLTVLSGADARLYRLLGAEALRLARQAGLSPELADRVEEALRERGV
ncbi:MAG TPA: Rossmann-like and DUF2520 domain-containing protein [Gemmatimonadales bacterium]|nr:Rossmann-like and DUF2520 domain-containing protein [Gemmatimonadales bacterium]